MKPETGGRPPLAMIRVAVSAAIVVTFFGCSSLPLVPDPLLLDASQWYTGEHGSVDDARARVLLEAAAADGDALSVMWLARVYSTGRMTYVADKPRAVALATGVIASVEALAEEGLAEAEFLLGTAYAEGLGKPIDATLAVQWYRRAAARQHVLAQHNLGNAYFSGTGVPQDDKQAVEWWILAATKGDAIPQLRLGTMYEQGRGVTEDKRQALFWYEQAARRGNADAIKAVELLQAK